MPIRVGTGGGSDKEFGDENGLGPNKEPSDEQTTELYEDIVLPSFAVQSEEIGELTPPAGDEETLAKSSSRWRVESKQPKTIRSNWSTARTRSPRPVPRRRPTG